MMDNKPVNPLYLALMQSGGRALSAGANPNATNQSVLGAALTGFGPSYLAAQRINEENNLRQALAVQRDAQMKAAQQKAQRQQNIYDKVKSDEWFGSLPPNVQKAVAPLREAGAYGAALDAAKTMGTQKPTQPNAFSTFMTGDPKLQAMVMEYNKARTPSASVNVDTGDKGPQVGTIPQGYQLIQTPGGAWQMQAIPGGPVATEQQEKEKSAEAAKQQKERSAGVVVEDIDRALDIVNSDEFTTTGMGGAAMSAVPGTQAHNLASLLDTVKANIGFDKLQAMRAASPTGGALGQVSERENLLLQSTFGSLKQSQSKEQFEYNLKRLKDLYLDIIHGPGNRPGSKDRSEVENMMPDDVKSLLDKYAPK